MIFFGFRCGRRYLTLFVTVFLLILGYSPDYAQTDNRSPAFLVLPFLGKPTQTSISINLVAGEKPLSSFLIYGLEDEAESTWHKTEEYSISALSPQEILLDSLIPKRNYRYKVFYRLPAANDSQPAYEGTFHTWPDKVLPFSFALLSDAHITPFNPERKAILSKISSAVLTRRPEFVFMLGDNIQTFTSHGGPMTEEAFGPVLYLHLRSGLVDLPAAIPVFNVIGNWEGENGWHPALQRQWASRARSAFIPTPGPETYPEGGGELGDYYGFTTNDVLFLVLTVTGYTLNDHALNTGPGKADDWTLGDKQQAWLHQQLEMSKARWKLILIHHTVGGNAGDAVNSRYGRGGGRAAEVGEQALIHAWMKKYHVQALFYGHDHVFTDIVEDGIHYICVGSAGAPWKFDRSITGYEKYWTPSGYTMVDVNTQRLQIEFYGVEEGGAGKEKPLYTFEIPHW